MVVVSGQGGWGGRGAGKILDLDEKKKGDDGKEKDFR